MTPMDDNEIYHWIAAIIKSCKNDFQLECAETLIELFSKRTKDGNLISALNRLKVNKFALIHGL
jgi:hypothetical protein